MSFVRMMFVVALGAFAAPAFAECLDPGSIEAGVVFSRADGRKGVAVKSGRSIAADYAKGDSQWTDERVSLFGIYDSSATIFRAPLPPGAVMVGSGAQEFKWSYSGVPPKPVAGKSWKTTIKESSTEDVGTQFGPERRNRTYSASFSFVEPREVTLSGCSYAAIAVEGSFTASDIRFTRRWVYFPDLGFGLETRSTDPRGHAEPGGKRGLTALGPAG